MFDELLVISEYQRLFIVSSFVRMLMYYYELDSWFMISFGFVFSLFCLVCDKQTWCTCVNRDFQDALVICSQGMDEVPGPKGVSLCTNVIAL